MEHLYLDVLPSPKSKHGVGGGIHYLSLAHPFCHPCILVSLVETWVSPPFSHLPLDVFNSADFYSIFYSSASEFQQSQSGPNLAHLDFLKGFLMTLPVFFYFQRPCEEL
jgi:hypothetical protein